MPVEGDQPHGLPMMTCPECKNHRGNTSVHYPWLDLSKIFSPAMEKRLRRGKARKPGSGSLDFSWEEFLGLRATIRQHLGSDLPLPPCAAFGTFLGKVFARPAATDFVITVSCKLLARRSAVIELEKLGIKLPFFKTELKQPPVFKEDYVQLYPVPAGESGQSSGNKYCPHCERSFDKARFIIKKPDPASNLDLFVLKDSGETILLSERLVAAASQLGLSGLDVRPVPGE